MNRLIADAFSLVSENVTDGPARDALRELWMELGRLEGQKLVTHRAGFNEACDRMGLPPADTPMERVAMAGGRI